MSEIHELIDEAVRRADETRAEDGNLVRAFLQGALAGICVRDGRVDRHNYGNVSPRPSPLGVSIQDVEVPRDADGDYCQHFIVVTESGHRIKISTELL